MTSAHTASDHDGLGKIFVAGTGRSGNTLLQNVLGSHPDVYAFPFESKFIVEGDGLKALVPRLSEKISITASDLALLRFMGSLGCPLPEEGYTSFKELDLGLGARIGEDNLVGPLKQFIAAITDKRFGETPYPRRFESREEVIAVTRRFLADFFGGLAVKHGKGHWSEKTPSNIIAMDFLWEIFPEAAIIHIKRDPRAVMLSFCEQPWLPSDPVQSATLLENIYWRWEQLKTRLDFNHRRYLEIRLKDLVAQPETVLPEIAKVAGLNDQFTLRKFSLAKVERWKTAMPAEQRRYCEKRFRRYFSLMGFDI